MKIENIMKWLSRYGSAFCIAGVGIFSGVVLILYEYYFIELSDIDFILFTLFMVLSLGIIFKK